MKLKFSYSILLYSVLVGGMGYLLDGLVGGLTGIISSFIIGCIMFNVSLFIIEKDTRKEGANLIKIGAAYGMSVMGISMMIVYIASKILGGI